MDNIIENSLNNSYKIIKQFYKTNNGELFLISDKLNENKESNFYFLNKIIIKTEEEKRKIEKDIDNLNKIDSKYIMKIIDHFIIHEEKKESMGIVLDFYENNLLELIYNKNFLNSRNIWKIFIQIILGLNSLNLNNILPVYLLPHNIYIDKENNIKIGGINIILDTINKNIQKSSIHSYFCPEILKGEKTDEKSIIWSLGCILYELAFKKNVFLNENDEEMKNKILKINYDLPNSCERELRLIIPKLICEREKRLTIKDLIFEGTFKNKIIEINLFSEFVKDNVKGK